MTVKKYVIAGMLLLASFALSTRVFASSDVQKVIDETYVQPDYVLGYSLSSDQQTETLNLLHYDSSQDTQIKILNTSDYASIMNVADDSSLQLYSSVKIKKLGSKEVLTVNIVTPNNITKVTEDMYRNAAVTLGIEHAEITVASPIAVTGESALAGIYYSLEQSGATVSDEAKSLAQSELSTLSDINAENTGKTGYDADKLNVALTDIKAAVADKGSSLTQDQAQTIVEETLDNYQLKDVLTSNQITLIVNFALNLSKSSIIKDSNFTKTLTSLKDSIVSKAGSTFSNINVNFNATQALTKGGNFLTNLWNKIVTFFQQLTHQAILSLD
ncbi:DUF1002 domain-containing protein [Streptococcus saliviloxodontae]|uniref:Uncharacterized protein YpuA (DUF1002 family) n=1 Tax=Streptococcus saliviloxodontae TaxID=1349416 RepID=A0ABS2PLC2_9STRE|nr:DUF1002 domain-containing protein [Streptococcus saliviloxodontae]MBM7635881.1 uncharacterized protein YpuA (DUF1002 family) [Streptococcus saliviloxodontae]